MSTYMFFSNETGEPVSVLMLADDADFDVPKGMVAALINGEVLPLEHYYIDGWQVKIRGPRPSEDHVWNRQALQWEFDQNIQYNRLRAEVCTVRNKLLDDSDWTDTLSAKERLGDELYGQWQAYRQALRDITGQGNFPLQVDWPSPPA